MNAGTRKTRAPLACNTKRDVRDRNDQSQYYACCVDR
jgi:hypothetical protein